MPAPTHSPSPLRRLRAVAAREDLSPAERERLRGALLAYAAAVHEFADAVSLTARGLDPESALDHVLDQAGLGDPLVRLADDIDPDGRS